MDKIEQLIERHLKGEVNEGVKICAFLTLALWGKFFVSSSSKFDTLAGSAKK
jgi:hypothetical protein